MKKVIVKYIIICLLVIIFINIFSTPIYATTLDDVMKGAQDFLSKGKGDNVDEKILKQTSSDVYNILLGISFVVVIIIGIILGIKFMTSDVENKAEVKKALIVFFVGCVVTYGAFAIWSAIVSFLNTL